MGITSISAALGSDVVLSCLFVCLLCSLDFFRPLSGPVHSHHHYHYHHHRLLHRHRHRHIPTPPSSSTSSLHCASEGAKVFGTITCPRLFASIRAPSFLVLVLLAVRSESLPIMGAQFLGAYSGRAQSRIHPSASFWCSFGELL